MNIVQQKDLGEKLLKSLPFTSALTLYEASHRNDFINILHDYSIYKKIPKLPFHSLVPRVPKSHYKVIFGKGPFIHGFLINISYQQYNPYEQKYGARGHLTEVIQSIIILVNIEDVYHMVELNDKESGQVQVIYTIYHPTDDPTPTQDNQIIPTLKTLFNNIFNNLVFLYSDRFISAIKTLDSTRIRATAYYIPPKYNEPISKEITWCSPMPPVGNSPDEITKCYIVDDKGEYVAVFHRMASHNCYVSVEYRYFAYSERLKRQHYNYTYVTIFSLYSGFGVINTRLADQEYVENAPIDLILKKINQIIYAREKNMNPDNNERIFKIIPRYPMMRLKTKYIN